MATIDSNEYIRHWEAIINAVDKTSFPLSVINSVSFGTLSGTRFKFNKKIDVQFLRHSGYDEDSIQEILIRTWEDFPEDDGEMEFDVNIKEVAHIASEISERYLRHC